ncbi:MAG TPA: ATP-grasp domain-containing protein [Planctomycetaceae bacterium]
MRIFVSEFVCGGGWPRQDAIAGSLAVEGRAMLNAVIEDLSQISDVKVVTTWDSRAGPKPYRNARTITIAEPVGMFVAFSRALRTSRRPQALIDWFEELSAKCDATLLIAPETDDVLGNLSRRIELDGRTLLSSSSAAVRLCADKLLLASHFESAGIRTIPTHSLEWQYASQLAASKHCLHFPLVVKPRDGAGSQNTYLVRSWSEFEWLRASLGTYVKPRMSVWQPYVAGRAVSVALMIPATGDEAEVFPVAEQSLSDDGRFFYKGGRIPARGVDQASIQAAALAACRRVPGLCGYVGVDLIIPADEQSAPVVVEINPRLTTSYLGYRALAVSNLAERMLPSQAQRPIEWRAGVVEFDAAGNTQFASIS